MVCVSLWVLTIIYQEGRRAEERRKKNKKQTVTFVLMFFFYSLCSSDLNRLFPVVTVLFSTLFFGWISHIIHNFADESWCSERTLSESHPLALPFNTTFLCIIIENAVGWGGAVYRDHGPGMSELTSPSLLFLFFFLLPLLCSTISFLLLSWWYFLVVWSLPLHRLSSFSSLRPPSPRHISSVEWWEERKGCGGGPPPGSDCKLWAILLTFNFNNNSPFVNLVVYMDI